MKQLFFVFFLLFTPLAASFPIFHLYLAEKWLELNAISNEEDQREFLLGTLFPDIRYLEECPRSKTHDSYPSLEKTKKAESFFAAGTVFHAWVDEMREFYLHRNRVEEKLPLHARIRSGLFLKLLEDEILYTSGAWKKKLEFLQEISREEKQKSSLASLKKWHFFLTSYLSFPPSNVISLLHSLHLNFFHLSESAFFSLSEDLALFAKKKCWQKHVEDLLLELELKMRLYLADARPSLSSTQCVYIEPLLQTP